MRINDLKPGWDVVGNDGHRIGRIQEVGQHFVQVSAGRFSSPIFVPASAIGNVEEGSVHLNMASGEVEAMGWQQPPRTSDELHAAPERDADREV